MAAKIPLLDLTQPMQNAARAGNVPYFAQDTHPNAPGHALMADAVADFVRGLR